MHNYRNRKLESAQGMVEYALIIVLVAVVLIVTLGLVGSQVSTVFSQVISGLSLESLQDNNQTLDEWQQTCYDLLNTTIDGRLVTHVRVDDFIDSEGRQAYQCRVIYDSSGISEPYGPVFYP